MAAAPFPAAQPSVAAPDEAGVFAGLVARSLMPGICEQGRLSANLPFLRVRLPLDNNGI